LGATTHIATLHQPDDNESNINAGIVTASRLKHVNVLFDTGAVNGNYVSEELAEELQKLGHVRQYGNDELVCGCFGDCKRTGGTLNVRVRIFSGSICVNEFECLTKVLDFKKSFNLVLGKETLIQNNLLQLLQTPTHYARHPLTKSRLTEQFRQNKLTKTLLNVLVNKTDLLSPEDDGEDESDESLGSQGEIPDHTTTRDSDDEILDKIQMEGTEEFKFKLRQLCRAYIDVLSAEVRNEPAAIIPMQLRLDTDAWRSRRNKQQVRTQTAAKNEEINKQIDAMLRLDVIEASTAEYYSQVHLTPKPNNKWRFCIDFRNLNTTSKSEGWPLPNIQQMLERLGATRAKFWGVFDLTSGYHQAPLDKDSRQYTAFITSRGLFQWKRVAMGLKSAGSYFQQRMAHQVLRGLIYRILEVYLDDIITYGQTEEELLDHIRSIFEALRAFKITVNPAKLRLGMREVEYVGHLINEHGKHFTRAKLAKILEWVQPSTQRQMKAFLGLANYFRDHVRNYAALARPLQQLTNNYEPRKLIEWTEDTLIIFEELRHAIDQCPILAWITKGGQTILCTDACNYGIGGYLHQIFGDEERPIAFVSKSLTDQQVQKWSTIEKEGYAIYYCLQKLQYLLRDIHFTIKTDHLNLAWKFLNNDTNPRVRRWKLAIQEFDFDIEYLQGEANIAADSLSRMPEERSEPMTTSTLMNLTTADDTTSMNDTQEKDTNDKITETETNVTVEPLYRIPESQFKITHERYQLMAKFHNARVGHVGVERLVNRVMNHLLTTGQQPWQYMRNHARQFIRLCPCCQKMATTKIAIQVTPFTLARYQPMECWNIDTIGPLEEDTHGNKYIIVMIDMFTRFVELKATKSTDARTAALFLYEQMGRYGTPKQILSDNGTQFCNELFDEYCKLTGVQQLFILAYSKEENGMVERANRSVMTHLQNLIVDRAIGTLPWSNRLPMVQRIINATVHAATGIAPQQLLYGNAFDIERRIFLEKDEIGPQVTTDRAETNTLREWFADMLTFQEQATIQAIDNQWRKDQRHIERGNQTRTQFEVGSLVLINYPHTDYGRDQPSRFHPKIRGPFRVIETKDNRIITEDLNTQKQEEHLILNARPFHYDPAFVNPKEVALTDNDLYVVEKVMAHKGDSKKRSTLEFKVKWLGYPNPSWEPYHNLRTNAHLHEYLRGKKLTSLIPKDFK
jgi:transposase InsO family protein